MSDADVVHRINELAEEEHRLENEHEGGALSEADRQRMKDLELALDQCWDLLRQRRARRAAGQDPDQAQARSESTVEHYLQ